MKRRKKWIHFTLNTAPRANFYASFRSEISEFQQFIWMIVIKKCEGFSAIVCWESSKWIIKILTNRFSLVNVMFFLFIYWCVCWAFSQFCLQHNKNQSSIQRWNCAPDRYTCLDFIQSHPITFNGAHFEQFTTWLFHGIQLFLVLWWIKHKSNWE